MTNRKTKKIMENAATRRELERAKSRFLAVLEKSIQEINDDQLVSYYTFGSYGYIATKAFDLLQKKILDAAEKGEF